MEQLMEALCALLSDVPDNPMVPEWIGIQSRGMKQWLTTSIAQKFGICANLKFLFPRQILELIMDHMDKDSLDKDHMDGQGLAGTILTEDILVWSIMDIFLTDPSALKQISGAGGPAGYLQGDSTGQKTLQLSRRIARVFDDYQVYRPDMLARWESRWAQDSDASFAGSGKDDMVWQSWIWNQLIQRGTPMSARMDRLLSRQGQSRGNGEDLPKRICLFGVSAMPPRFLDAFALLGEKIEINLFLLTPSSQFFFDIRSRKQIDKQALATPLSTSLDIHSVGNPLLASLGRTGREFHGILESFDYDEPFGDLFFDPLDEYPLDEYPLGNLSQAPTMLSVLQSDTLNLVNRIPEEDPGPVPVSHLDQSIAIHACHSPMREAQVLKDLLLDALEKDADLHPHDIIVMMPDIEAYAPFLEAVFSQEMRIPYTVSDRRKRSESMTLDAFLKILNLRDARLELGQIMDLLLSPVIASKFNIPIEDQGLMEEILRVARVLWGRDEIHRQEITGKGFGENTWAFGMHRLFMGYSLPGGETDLAENVLPCDRFEGLEAEVLGNFSHFIYTLFHGLSQLDTPKKLVSWGRCLKALVRSMMKIDTANEGDIGFLLKAIEALVQEGDAAGFDHKVGFAVVQEILEAKLGQSISQGSFLAGSLTFCNLMPMRSIPFKVVVLMGMDEHGFPRKPKAPGFNLIQKRPTLGDKQEREEDCYLFLESLLSARQRFIVTYTGMGISDNSPIPCAGPVAELADAMASSFEFPNDFVWQFSHPLHPFNPAYFLPVDPGKPLGEPEFFSFSRAQCRIAQGQQARGTVSESRDLFIDQDLIPGLTTEVIHDISRLAGFFRHPVQDFVTHRLGLTFPDPGQEIQDREVFQLSGLDQYSLGQLCLDRNQDGGTYPLVRASGLLPLGQKGEMEWERINGLALPVAHLAKTLIPEEKPRVVNIDLAVGNYQFTGQVPDVYPQGRYVAGFGLLTPARLLNQWILHLFYSAMVKTPGPTHILGRDPQKKKPASVYVFAPVPDTAGAQIKILADLYQKGQDRVLPFFSTPCFHLIASLADKAFEITDQTLEKALGRARPHWNGNPLMPGEAENRYTALVYGNIDPFDTVDTLVNSGLLDNGLAVFKPLLENLSR